MWWDPYNKKVAFARGREWDWKFYQKNLRKWEYLSLKIKKHRFNGDYLAIILKTFKCKTQEPARRAPWLAVATWQALFNDCYTNFSVA